MDELNTPMVMPPEESIPDWYDGKRINGITFFPQEPPYLLSITIYRKIKLYRLQRHL